MTRRIACGPRAGCVRIPASKSQVNRLLICAALGERELDLFCSGISADISATMACLRALGASLRVEGDRIRIRPIRQVPEGRILLPCGESGSTLRFLLPLAGALGADAVLRMEGRLPHRPIEPLVEQLRANGMSIRREGELLFCSGRLKPGDYRLPGDVSSQYISGLLLALPLLRGESRLFVDGRIESGAYVRMTEDALRLAGVSFESTDRCCRIPGSQRFSLPDGLRAEGDWSNAAFFLCLGALSSAGIRVEGLNTASSQGDRAVVDILRRFGAQVEETDDAVLVRSAPLRGLEIDAAPIPDLVPALSVVASAAEGESRILRAARLRLKESDRLRATSCMLSSLGAEIEELPDALRIRGKTRLAGGRTQSFGDHRIAMAAAVAAACCERDVLLDDAACVGKSYPRFWEDLEGLTR